jgi:arylformamidase
VPDTPPDRAPEYRAHFDAHVEFVNGGSLSAEGFRLDLPGGDVDADEVARLFVQHLGLALVGSVELHDLEIVEEPHRGSRGIETGSAAASGRRLVDLSHVIREGLITYPGLPAPVISSHLTREDSRSHYAAGTEFAMDIVTMIGNTGTYLDSPYHRYNGGTDLAGLELASLVDLPAEVFHLTDSGERGVPASVFFDRDVRGKAVLLHTGWDRLFGTPEYGRDAPFLARDGVAYLVEQGAALVGIDSLNIDEVVPHGERPAHSELLAAGIHVVEHLTNLGALPPSGARFTAVPPKFAGFGTFPVRAYATIG